MEPQTNIPMLIVTGKGRSGSTMLQFMLDAHPQVCAPLESRFFLLFHRHYCGKLNPDRKALFKQLEQHLQFDPKLRTYWSIDRQKLERLVTTLPEKAHFGDLVKAVYLCGASPFPREKIELIVDKNPIHTYYLPELQAHFPEAKFVHLVRDPRANIASVLKFAPNTNVEMQAMQWVTMNRKVLEHQRGRESQFMLLRYEDLINDYSAQLQKICNHVDLPYSTEMESYHEKLANYATDFVEAASSSDTKAVRARISKAMHNNLKRAPDPNLVDKWKQRLTGAQIETIEGICGDEMIKFGYSKLTGSTQPPATTTKLKFAFNQWKRKTYFKIPHPIKSAIFPPRIRQMETVGSNHE